MRRPLWAGILMVFLASPGEAADPAPCDQPTLTCTSGLCRLEVSFPAANPCVVRIDDSFIAKQSGATRITEKTTVRIRIRRANLLKYAVAFDTKETVVESYVYLEKLWKQVLGLGLIDKQRFMSRAFTDAARSEEEGFVDAINAWRTGLDAKTKWLAGERDRYRTLTLDAAEVTAVEAAAKALDGHRKAIDDLRQAARDAIARAEHFPVYDGTLAAHQAILETMDAFEVLAGQVVDGLDRKITFGAAGRVVAVTVTATDRGLGKEQTQAIGVEFFVHSTLPVTFHAGYTIRGLKEQDFETVASSLAGARGADLFSKVQDSTANGTFTAFLSYRLCNVSRARRCTHLTLGTDFKNVGDRLYGGLSWPVGRSFLTVGVVSGETKEGEGVVADVIDAAGQATGARDLFTAVSTKRKWGGFVGVSFAPF